MPHRVKFEFGSPIDATQLTALSLFILLLAFFIVMNGVSKPSEERTRVVFHSVYQAFGVSIRDLNTGSSLLPSVQDRRGSGTSVRDIAGRFQAEIPGLSLTYLRSSGTLQITLMASDFNRLLGMSGGGNASENLRQLLAAMAPREEKSTQHDLVLLLHRRPALYDSHAPIPPDLDQYALSWADRLVALGLPPDRLTFGLMSGPPGRVTMIVRARPDIPATPPTPQNNSFQNGLIP